MNEPGKSDKPVVPAKPAKISFWDLFQQRIEQAEGRGLAKENEEGSALLPVGPAVPVVPARFSEPLKGRPGRPSRPAQRAGSGTTGGP
jgi:hypothetical protein